jgi:glucose-1-phosphate adenylyltransferase
MNQSGGRVTDRTTCFVLAGGAGKRLRPLTLETPKPLLSFGAVHCLLDFTLSNIANSGLCGADVLSQYRQEAIDDHLRTHWRSPAEAPLFRSRPPRAGSSYRGTGDAVAQNIGCAPAGCDLVLVVSADHVYAMDYRRLLERHIQCGRGVTVAAICMPLRLATSFGVLEVTAGGDVIGFAEKPERPSPLPGRGSHALANMGIYVFDRATLTQAFDDLRDAGPALDFGQDVMPYLAERNLAVAHVVEEDLSVPYWRDVGTLDAYYGSQMDLLEGRLSFDPLDPRWPVRSSEKRLIRGQSLVADSAVLGECLVDHAVISSGAVVEDGAQVSRSILLPGAHVGRRARVSSAILQAGARVGAGERIGLDRTRDAERFDVTPSGIVVVPERRPDPVPAEDSTSEPARRPRSFAG